MHLKDGHELSVVKEGSASFNFALGMAKRSTTHKCKSKMQSMTLSNLFDALLLITQRKKVHFEDNKIKRKKLRRRGSFPDLEEFSRGSEGRAQ